MTSSATPNIGLANDVTRYAYNLDKDLTQITRPDGQTINYVYDAGGRLSSITFPSATVGYTYGVGGCVSCGGAKLPDSITRTQTATGSAETLNYTYDGSLLLSESWSGAVAGNVSVTYDNDFRVVTQSVNGANPVTLGYDTDGLLTSVGSLTLTRSATNGSLTGTTLGAVSDNIIYSNYGETTSYNATVSGASMFDVKYTRDVLGRIAQKVETINGAVTTYDYIYDVTGRLTDVNKNGVNISHYIYDSNGNRVTATVNGITSQGFFDLQDRMTKYGNAIYTYTANGELQTKTDTTGVTTYNYDAFGNLLSVTLPNGTLIEYIIDGKNRRVGKKVNGVLVYGLLYKDQLNPVAELDGAGNVVSRFVYGVISNLPEYMIKGGVTYRIIRDHLGSPRLIVDTATGNVIQRIDYDEFGNIVNDTNPGFQPFGYAGGLYDKDTGLVRFGARDYDATTGRWTSKDPIGFKGGDANLFGYVVNDPINKIDPSGTIVPLAAMAIVGGAEVGADAIAALGAGIASIALYVTAVNSINSINDSNIPEIPDFPHAPDPSKWKEGQPVPDTPLKVPNKKCPSDCVFLYTVVREPCKTMVNPLARVTCESSALAVFIACLVTNGL